MIKVEFKNVAWDTDGATLKSCGLKTRFIANVDIDFDCNTDDDEIADMLSDWLSDNYGYCHNGFDYEIISPTITISDDKIKNFFKESMVSLNG